MHEFEYYSPKSLDEAVGLMASHQDSARPIAGGTDLIEQMRLGRHTPKVVIDVKQIDELTKIEVDEKGLTIGAAVNCRAITRSAVIRQDYAALADSSQIIGGIQIQSRASFGGNLCNSGPAADSIPSMIVLGGVCRIASREATRDVAVADFCKAPGENVLRADELLRSVHFPLAKPRSGSHYRRVIPRNEMDIAIVGAAAYLELAEDESTILGAKIALAAVGPTPVVADEAAASLIGQTAEEGTFEKAAEAVRAAVMPIDDMRGTKEYRTHVASVLTRRVLAAANLRAKGQEFDYHPGR